MPPTPLPATGPIQFMPAGGAYLEVDSISDPNGAPSEVIDVDQGFTVKGTVVFPNWIGGNATVCIWADEQGGTIDQALTPCANITLTAGTNEPNTNPATYPWSIDFGPGVIPGLPDPSTGSQVYRLLAKFMYQGQATDVAGFVDLGLYLIN